MMNRNDLTRIKGILSARLGALIPKLTPGGVVKVTSVSYEEESDKYLINGLYVVDKATANYYFRKLGDAKVGDMLSNSAIIDYPEYKIPVNNENISSDNSNQPDINTKGNGSNGVQLTTALTSGNNPINNSSAVIPALPLNTLNGDKPNTTIVGGTDTDPNGAVKDAAKVQDWLGDSIMLDEVKVIEENRQGKRQIAPLNFDSSGMSQPLTRPLISTPLRTKRDIIQHNRGLEKEKRQMDRDDNIINKKFDWSLVGLGLSLGIQVIGGAIGAHQTASDSETTRNITAGWDTTATIASQFGPIGEAVGTVMGLAKGAGDIIQSITGGTDLITKTDQWMSSPLLSWNVGIVNDWFAKKSDALGVDQSTLATVGSSYGGSASDIRDLSQKADKKIGLLAGKERREINSDIAKARASQLRMRGIADSVADQRMLVQSMGEQAGLAYSMMADGGYNLKYTYAAKHGGSLEWNPVIELEWEPQVELNWELPTFKDGGSVELVEKLEWIPELQSGNKINLDEVYNFYKDYDLSNIEFITDESPRTEGNKLYIRNDEDAIHELWHYLSNNQPNEVYKDYYDNLNDDRIIELGGDLQFVKRFENDPGHFYHPSELEARIKAAKFKTRGQTYTKEFFQNLRKDENKYGNNMRDLLHMYNDDNLVKIFSLKRGGSLGDSDIPETEETTQKNVIPEGALHKNKHHMEHAEGLTKKGIPVIDEEGEQQAEIEHSEIIFTLEVTKKLEEYYEIFYSEESTNKEKEQAALDAGKLLVYQILENTEDRTGLIESCKKGGTLTLKKSTDDLIEEVLEWMPTVVIVETEEEPKKESKKEESEVSKKDTKDEIKDIIKEVLIELLVK